MSVLFGLLWPLERFNTGVLAIGKAIAVAALGIMVCLILGQVFFRYVLNDAPNWTEAAARFLMLWMTGLMAPLAYRKGGFVAIDMLERALQRHLAAILTFFILLLSLMTLLVMWDKGWNNHVNGLLGRGCGNPIPWPFGIELGRCGGKVPDRYAFLSLWVGVNLLLLVNIELILRQMITFFGGGSRLTQLAEAEPTVSAS